MNCHPCLRSKTSPMFSVAQGCSCNRGRVRRGCAHYPSTCSQRSAIRESALVGLNGWGVSPPAFFATPVGAERNAGDRVGIDDRRNTVAARNPQWPKRDERLGIEIPLGGALGGPN